MDRNLYVLDTVVENHFTHFFKAEDMTLEQWHSFLGHPSLTTMKHMKQLSGRFHEAAKQAIQNCEICIKAKHARDPFPLLNRRTSQLFELVHADLWGPYVEESMSNTSLFSHWWKIIAELYGPISLAQKIWYGVSFLHSFRW